MTGYLNWDRELFLFINSHHSPWCDDLMLALTSRWTAIPLYVLLAIILIRKYPGAFLRIFIAVGFMILVSDQVSVSFKFLFERLRPCHEPAISQFVHLVEGKCGGIFGFYSSHASNTSSLVFFVFPLLRKNKILPFLFIWCFWVGYSRIYLGSHYPLDVMAGWVAGATIGWISSSLLRKFLPVSGDSIQ